MLSIYSLVLFVNIRYLCDELFQLDSLPKEAILKIISKNGSIIRRKNIRKGDDEVQKCCAIV